jgi:hypothetical protein
MLKDLNKDQLLLEELMSQISEEGFYAGWMAGLEFDLWRIINGDDKRYGHHVLTQEEIDRLWSLARKCGCWIVFDDEKEETAIDLDIWEEMFLNKKSAH